MGELDKFPGVGRGRCADRIGLGGRPFLAATKRKGEGIPLLEKAKRLGVAEADYWLGLSYQLIGNKAKAIESLESYTKHAPNDQQAAVLLQAIRDDKFEIKMGKPKGAP